MGRTISFFVLFFTLVSVTAFSQTSTSSPYSRFGIGNLNGGISAEQLAMGGNSVAYLSEHSINSNNPASYSILKPKSLLLSTSVTNQTYQFSTTSLTQKANNTNFGHLSIAMPINEKIFVSSGLLPYSDIGYVLEYSDNSLLSGTDSTNIDYIYTGNGGVSNYYLATSIKLNRSISFGVNASYLFGGLSRNRTVDFNDETILNTSVIDRTNLSGIALTGGALFNTSLGEKKDLTIGITYQDNSKISARRNLLGTTYEIINTALSVKDTFENRIDTGNLVLPNKISAGMSYSSDKWTLLINYSSQNWKEYQLKYGDDIQKDSLENNMYLSAGIQYVPDYNSVTNYWKRIRYRFGARYDKSYLQINNNQLTEMALTFGLGLPVKRSNTFYNISMEIGERGTTSDNLIKEEFIRFGIGVTFKGIWFVKKKYD